MSAQTLKTSGLYITPTGKLVRVLSATNGLILLKSLQSDNQFSVSVDYPLRALRKNELAACCHSANPTQVEPQKFPVTLKPLAPLIDAMLLRGGMTMRGIVREVKRKASASCKGRDVPANVRARMYWLRRRGFRVERDADGRLKVIGQQ